MTTMSRKRKMYVGDDLHEPSKGEDLIDDLYGVSSEDEPHSAGNINYDLSKQKNNSVTRTQKEHTAHNETRSKDNASEGGSNVMLYIGLLVIGGLFFYALLSN